jgi:hypothetical protein
MNKAKENPEQMLSNIHNACAALVMGLCLSILLVACGGADGHTGVKLTGKVIDGYIGGATVCLSPVSASSMACDGSIASASAVTDASGNYSFSFPSGTSLTGRHVIAKITVGNTDADAASGLVQAAYAMAAPVETPSVVSPFTTMVSQSMMIYPASGIAAAQASVASSVGVPAGSLAADYIANSNSGYHNIAKMVAALLPSVGAAPTYNQANVNAIFTSVNLGAASAVSGDLTGAIAAAQASYNAAGVGTVGTVTYATAFNTTNSLTTDGGTLSAYSFTGTGSSFTYTGTDPASTYWYGGYNFTTNPSSTEGVGIFVAAPGVIASGADSGNGLTVNGATSLTIPISVGTEVWTSTSHTMSLHVVAQGKFNKYGGNCTVLVYADIPVTAQPMTTYVIPVSSFTLGQSINYALSPGLSCGQAGITDVVSALADGVAEIHVQAIGANLNHTVLATGGGYPTGLTFGSPITFQAVTSAATTTLGTPGAPAYASAVAGNALATVSFPASTSTGGNAITGYTVTSIPAGGLDSNAGTTALTHTITGLANGTSYRFTVHATNSKGNGSESAPSNAVTPSATLQSLAVRALPGVYASTVKAINYSAYRAGGPGLGEIPTDAQINEDLALLNSAGYTLLRLFDTDPSHERILQLAATHPTYNMKFQLGIYLSGIAAPSVHPNDQASCIQTANDTGVQNGIREANTYANVASISVGNETSFFSTYMPAHCLASYVTTVKQGTSVPVTADYDYTFYIGSGSNSIIPLLDFVSIHTYPMSNPTRWTYTGTRSATAMMTSALVNAQLSYSQVASYISAHGGTGLPIVIGETGWKAAITNAPNPLESCCANPVNAKMYFDSMNTWQAAGGTGPKAIFYFEAFDEAWKGNDDGWGIWDAARTPRFALCGTAVTGAPSCASPPNTAAFAP